MKIQNGKLIGLLMMVGSILLLVTFTALTMIFNSPTILREDPGVILQTFHDGGTLLIGAWWAFAMVGLPLIEAAILLGQELESKLYYVRWATSIGIIGFIVQIIGLLRWTFVVPVLANTYITGDQVTKSATIVVFQTIHQYGGVLLGEHLGQIFTILWTIMMAAALSELEALPKWTSYLGYIASFIYLLAQAELFATVIPSIPYWGLAGFLGSTLWLVWLLVVGYMLRRE